MDLNLNEVDSLVHQWLLNEGYHDVATVLQEEANLKIHSSRIPAAQVTKIKAAILDGDWVEVEKLCIKYSFKNHKSFLYAIYKQGYLELLEKQEYQKAFAYLTKLLKPLESRQPDPEDFRDLCYLLTCKSVQDASSFKNWEGGKEGRSREKLVEQFESLLNVDYSTSVNAIHNTVNSHRLTDLLSQAVAFQVETTTSYTPKVTPKINTLLEDYKSIKLPYSIQNIYKGHKDNVKCVQFIEQYEDTYLVTGSSDNTLKIWGLKNNECINTLEGHASRIWDVTTNKSGKLLVSASGDSTVKLWNISDVKNVECIQTFKGHEGDVYTVQFHPGQNHIVSGGYDKIIRLFDVRTSMLKSSFIGHNSSISSTIFNPLGNMMISGSKDNTIKFWDIGSGLCIKTISSHLGEVTSIDINSSGSLLLSSSKDNSNRLWDLRTAKPVRKFKGHQNTSKNFIRACFGPEERLILGGSEDGSIYIWDIETGNILQKIVGHSDLVYAVASKKDLLASCSHDNTAATWKLAS